MNEIPLEEFVRRLRRLLTRDSMLAFFLGAGASVSSGIPGAGKLADRWVHELYETEAGKRGTFEAWRSRSFPTFDADNPAGSYSTAMRRLFPTQAERQEEIERIVRGHDPGFAYATLSQLLAHETLGPRCNVVLTTNFDDLVADALYLFTRTRPLVVTHEALVAYAALGRTRPTVIKVHGDAMLQPRNTPEELAALAPQFVEALQSHLRSRALIMLGYGGNDAGVCAALSALPRETITHGIYWVNEAIPETPLGDWLRSHPESFWVRHLDFDELMSVVKAEFDLPNPDDERFKQLLDRYRSTFSDLQKRVTSDGGVPDVVAESVEEVSRRFGDWFSAELEAQKYKKSDPDRAARVYEEGITELPGAAPLLGSYATFLTNIRHDHDRAQHLYERAITADPNQAIILGSYAVFLKVVRHDHDRAQELYERAIAAQPNHPDNLGNYALLLTNIRLDHDRAQQLYERAITADPNHATHLGNYAVFLMKIRHDHDRAERLYERAITADPSNVNNLGNYAIFLKNIRHDHDRAQQLYERAITADPNNANNLGNYAGILYAQGELERANVLAQRARSSDEYALEDRSDLRLEMAFYQLANGEAVSSDERQAIFAELHLELLRGTRSPGWDLAANIARARELRTVAEVDFLVQLAAVINDEARVDSLAAFAEWPSGSLGG